MESIVYYEYSILNHTFWGIDTVLIISTACGHRMAYRKWKETRHSWARQQAWLLLSFFHFLWAILWLHPVDS